MAYSMADHVSGSGRRRRAASSAGRSASVSSHCRASPSSGGPEVAAGDGGDVEAALGARPAAGHEPVPVAIARSCLPWLPTEAVEVDDVADRPAGRRPVAAARPAERARRTPACTDIGRPRARRARVIDSSGSVISDAPRPTARAASSRFCTLG